MLGKDEEEEIHAVRKPGFASARQQALAKHSDRRAYMALRVCPYSDQSVQGWISIPVVSLETGGSLLMSHPLRVLTGNVPQGVWVTVPITLQLREF